MFRSLLWLAILGLTGWTSGVQAQAVWTYITVGPDGKSTVTKKPPVDISYPRSNEPMPVFDPRRPQGVPLTASEIAARQRAPHLIILMDSTFHNY